MNRRAMRKTFSKALAPLVLAALSLAGCGPAKTPLDQAPLAGAQIGGEFALIDKAGKTVKWADFAGKWRMVYFGYTYCPDACPTDVGRMMAGFKKFAAAEPALAAKVVPIFVTIDPARDTPARVGEFAAAFSPTMVGLTGPAPEIDKAAKAFAVYYARGAQQPGGYLMDHSRIAYLFDPAGKPVATLPIEQGPNGGPDAVAAELSKWVR